MFGRWLEMDYDLANFSDEKIDKLITPEGKEIEFSLHSYILISTSLPVFACI